MGFQCDQGFNRVAYLRVMTRLYERYDFQGYTSQCPLTAIWPVIVSVGMGDLLEGTPWGLCATRVSTESYISGSRRVSMDDMTFRDTFHGVHLLQPGPVTVSVGMGDLLEGTPWGFSATTVSTESYI